ncbi:Pre-rRNA-processing protein IPI3 [Sphaceloma murrayae]|uniref:Pre-rRNA-processing protein IPI3 n=1 Tax=Sphaceloma murrayae TaxID=2082308 RepID=A0A2K1R3S2_9PEZI|nr:Pre-rRNA-processing protein IPI3 [Sphaceloma murrayae]
MLTESLYITLSSHFPKPSTTFPKDASIFHHRLQPSPTLLSILKKSSTPRNCFASSPTHLFAAQSDKALLHVYARETGTLQTTVPFRERITSLALVDDGLTVVCGTEAGSLIIWETLSGRTIKTGEAHLGAVSSLAVDDRGHFALTGSEDGNVHVWNLGAVRSWGDVGESLDYAKRAPVRTLRGHGEGVVDLRVGMGIAVSAAGDGLLVWDYREGTLLRTILLPEKPTSLELDPCERAAFVGFEDGSVVCVDFFGMDGDGAVVKNAIWDEEKRSVAVQIAADEKWPAPSEELGATTCMGLSHDSTKLITGHVSGKVIVWDIPSGTYHSQLTSTPLPGPISNLNTLPVQGFAFEKDAKLKIKEVVKPRFGELDSTDGQIPANYRLTAHLVGQLDSKFDSAAEVAANGPSDFERSLYHPAFPEDILAESIADIVSWQQKPTNGTSPQDLQADFMALDENPPAETGTKWQSENEDLKKQVAALRRQQKVAFARIEKLESEKGTANGSVAASRSREEMDEPEKVDGAWNLPNGASGGRNKRKKPV